MKFRIVIISLIVLVISCKTYTITPENFKSQLTRNKVNKSKEVTINNPLMFGNIKYLSNDIERLKVIDKKGNELTIPNSPALEMRVTHKNGKKFYFYFDTVFLENDTLKGGKSRFIPSLSNSIPFDSIIKIEIQDGGKNFNYQK